MNGLKRLCAALLALLLLGSVCACHKKDEVAVTVEDEKFTSAAYMFYLLNANSEGMTKVEEGLTDEEKESGDYDVYKKEIDGKSFETWVKDTALENLKESAAYILLCKKNGVELDEDEVSNLDTYVEYYWTSYLAPNFEPNGVSKETYTACLKHSLYKEAYFNSLYGESGTKAIAEDDLKKELGDNFILADRLDVTFSEETDDEKAQIKTRLEGYVKALQDGSRTFEEIYHEYNGEEETAETETAETEETEEETIKPKDDHANLIVSEEMNEKVSQYNGGDIVTSDYDTVKEMKNGEIKLQEKEDGAGYVLLVRKDVLADEYYWKDEVHSSMLRHLLKDEEFDAEIDAFVKDMKVDVNKSAVDRFKVKKLEIASES